MKLRKELLTAIIGLGLVTGGAMIAQDRPEHDIGRRHPNLSAAQRLVDQAFGRITAAQQANEFDMDGHAAKAKELLEQANHELKEAAEAANRNHR